MCGDSSSDQDVDRLVNGAIIDLTNTDPPYNCKVHSRSNAGLSVPGAGGFPSPSQDKARKAGKLKVPKKMRAKDRPMTNDHVSDEQFFELLVRWFRNFSRVMRPGASFYVWGGFSNWKNYCAALEEVGDLHFAQGITWFKHWPVLSRTDFMNDTENAWYGWKTGASHRFFGGSNISNCWEVKRLHPPSMIHLTEKPVELATRAMQYSSLAGENVLDLFGGSGSTLIAAEQNDRKSRTVGMDHEGFAILTRWLDAREGLDLRPNDPVFCLIDGRTLNSSYVRVLLPRLASKAGIARRIHAHGLRHTHAAELRAEGVDIGVISKQLGHRSIATTARYLDHIAPWNVVEAMQKRAW